MSLSLNVHREAKDPNTLIVSVENPDGKDFSEEAFRMAAELLRIRGAQMEIRIPTGRTFEEIDWFSRALLRPAEPKKDEFSVDVHFKDEEAAGTVAIVKLKGDFTSMGSAFVLRDAMQHVDASGVLFDLSEMTRISDDGAMGQFISEWTRATNAGRTVMVCGPLLESIDKRLKITGLQKMLNVHPDQGIALQQFREEAPMRHALLATIVPTDLHQ